MSPRPAPADLPPGSWPPLHDLARWIGTWLFRPIYRMHRHGARIPATGPVVLVANHSAFIDGPLLYGAFGRRTVFLVKKEMFAGPLAWVLPRIGQLAVDRGRPDRAPLMAAQAILRGGGLVAVFPEGTRGTGDMTSARSGAAWLARTTGAVVVPLVCRGTRRPDGAGRRFRPRVDVVVGEPFRVSDKRGRTGLTEATEQVRSALAGLIVELDRTRDAAGVPPAEPAPEV
ncbi:MAG TPA: lysophospholipid acyltransferase family protein [Pseudonocardia sp.]|jgi:1-acyl-sn-glycerol-3-phosphate acyltransferase